MSGHAIQRLVRQSPRKMRLVIDLIRGKDVNEAYAILKFNKKLAAKQIAKTLKSAVANAEQKALKDNERFDPDALVVSKAIVFCASTRRCATVRRRRVIGTVSSSRAAEARAGGEGADSLAAGCVGLGSAAGGLAC